MVNRYRSRFMDKLKQELINRFPLLDCLTIRANSSSDFETFPYVLGILLAATESREKHYCCLLLPKTDGAAFSIAILLALSKLKEEFPALLANYAQTSFHRGEKVRVLPTKHVYEYIGLWPEHEHLFQLKVLDSSDIGSFPVSEILRLEPTTRVRPKGKLNIKLGKFELCSLDHLINISTGGNRSFFKNHVLYLGSKNEFIKFLKFNNDT